MNDYEMKVLIDELQKLVVNKQMTINSQQFEIDGLKKEIKRLEHLLTPIEVEV